MSEFTVFGKAENKQDTLVSNQGRLSELKIASDSVIINGKKLPVTFTFGMKELPKRYVIEEGKKIEVRPVPLPTKKLQNPTRNLHNPLKF